MKAENWGEHDDIQMNPSENVWPPASSHFQLNANVCHLFDSNLEKKNLIWTLWSLKSFLLFHFSFNIMSGIIKSLSGWEVTLLYVSDRGFLVFMFPLFLILQVTLESLSYFLQFVLSVFYLNEVLLNLAFCIVFCNSWARENLTQD